jgi:hypothetical protein
LIKTAEMYLDALNSRRETRLAELERHSAVSGIKHLGRAWVVPQRRSERSSRRYEAEYMTRGPGRLTASPLPTSQCLVAGAPKPSSAVLVA